MAQIATSLLLRQVRGEAMTDAERRRRIAMEITVRWSCGARGRMSQDARGRMSQDVSHEVSQEAPRTGDVEYVL
ncbi:MAG TPA: hypothetical protein VGW38_24925, partial [Chloroflexota bacterium]|nr:hypothetical protein [Chloroflexota bacterium]